MPKKAMRNALLSILNARLTEEMIKPVVKIEVSKPKTKEFKGILTNLKVNGKTLVIVDDINEDVRRSSRNIENVMLKEGRNINARDVLLNENIIIEKDALLKLTERLK